jgi:aspartyl-tRNA(Asn)/glutamyl-tRNA(Gln) amidotransferase subunit A
VEDLALLLEVMAGPDGYDATAIPDPPPSYASELHGQKKFRIAYLRQALHHPALDTEIAAGLEGRIEELKRQGHQVSGIDADFLEYIVPAYYVLTTAEASSNLARYDGVRFGYRTESPVDTLEDFYKLSRSEGFGKEVKRRIMLGTFVLSAGYFDAYFGRAQQARQWMKDKTELIFNEFDILLLPTSPTTAFRFGEMSQSAVSMFLADIFTVYANLAGIPAVSFPVGIHSNGMPFGIQALSSAGDELTLLQFVKSQYP